MRTLELGRSELTLLTSRRDLVLHERPQKEHFLSYPPIGHETNIYSYSSHCTQHNLQLVGPMNCEFPEIQDHVLAFSVSQLST